MLECIRIQKASFRLEGGIRLDVYGLILPPYFRLNLWFFILFSVTEKASNVLKYTSTLKKELTTMPTCFFLEMSLFNFIQPFEKRMA
jgi:hypothetical protein